MSFDLALRLNEQNQRITESFLCGKQQRTTETKRLDEDPLYLIERNQRIIEEILLEAKANEEAKRLRQVARDAEGRIKKRHEEDPSSISDLPSKFPGYDMARDDEGRIKKRHEEDPSSISDLPSKFPGYDSSSKRPRGTESPTWNPPMRARKPRSPACEFLECNMCDKEAKGQCNKCGKAKYCSRKCQAKDWEVHKLECGISN